MPRQYPPAFRQRAVLLAEEARPEYQSEFEAIRRVAAKLGMSSGVLRRWCRNAEIDAGDWPGMTSLEHAEVKRLKRENAELRRANEIVRAASAVFAAELDRPTFV